MGYYIDKRGVRRYCNNPNHSHYWAESGGPGYWLQVLLLWILVPIGIAFPPLGALLIIIGLVYVFSRKNNSGNASGWCK